MWEGLRRGSRCSPTPAAWLHRIPSWWAVVQALPEPWCRHISRRREADPPSAGRRCAAWLIRDRSEYFTDDCEKLIDVGPLAPAGRHPPRSVSAEEPLRRKLCRATSRCRYHLPVENCAARDPSCARAASSGVHGGVVLLIFICICRWDVGEFGWPGGRVCAQGATAQSSSQSSAAGRRR